MKNADIKCLKVGDMVCDCRFQHLRVKSIEEVWLPRKTAFYNFIGNTEWLSDSVACFIMDLHDKLFRFLGITELVDKDVILEDGAHCSASACLDPVNTHSLSDHPGNSYE